MPRHTVSLSFRCERLLGEPSITCASVGCGSG
jgi:hypothetical protein